MSGVELVARVPDQIRPLLRAEYDRLVDAGVFDGESIELLEGVLVRMGPQDAAHSEILYRLATAIERQLPTGLRLRQQLPLSASELSEPEPDLAVVPDASYMRAHPARALLVVEVARTSQRVDLGSKVGVYAEAVEEYWVVDVPIRTVHVHRDPRDGRYADTEQVTGVVASTAVPGVEVDLDALFRD